RIAGSQAGCRDSIQTSIRRNRESLDIDQSVTGACSERCNRATSNFRPRDMRRAKTDARLTPANFRRAADSFRFRPRLLPEKQSRKARREDWWSLGGLSIRWRKRSALREWLASTGNQEQARNQQRENRSRGR